MAFGGLRVGQDHPVIRQGLADHSSICAMKLCQKPKLSRVYKCSDLELQAPNRNGASLRAAASDKRGVPLGGCAHCL